MELDDSLDERNMEKRAAVDDWDRLDGLASKSRNGGLKESKADTFNSTSGKTGSNNSLMRVNMLADATEVFGVVPVEIRVNRRKKLCELVQDSWSVCPHANVSSALVPLSSENST